MSTTTIGLRDPDDLITVLPYQLGYHPRRSVVVVALEGRRIGVVARSDLPPPDPDLDVSALVDAVVAPLHRAAVDRVVVVGYEDAPDESLPLLCRVVEALEAGRTEVVDVSVVRGGRRYSPTCSGPCCPPDGVPLPDPGSVPAVAQFVALGRAPLADRDALERLVAFDDRSADADAWAFADRAGPRRRGAVRAWSALLAAPVPGRPAPVPTRRLVTAVTGLSDVPLRDALVAWLVPGLLPRASLDPAAAALVESRLPRWGGMGRPYRSVGGADPVEHDRLLHVLLGLCRAVPDERPRDAAAMCAVAAHVAFYGGDGALARTVLARALRLAPDYRLAVLLDRLVGTGLDPRTLLATEADDLDGTAWVEGDDGTEARGELAG